ncbi:hypothetical protein BROUX41_006441 [Berkeleyomyces rouxiae]
MRKLFKKGDKDKGSASPAENPYAATPQSNYAPSVTSTASAAPSYRTQDPNPNPPRPMGGQPAPRNNGYGNMAPSQQQRQPQQQYTSTTYGASSGYGSNQYGTAAGGYGNNASRNQGGNSRTSDQAQDVNHARLMEGAKPVGSNYGGFQSNPYSTNAAPPNPQNPYANSGNPNDMQQQQQQPRGRYFDLTQEEDPDDREYKDAANKFLEEKAQTNDTLDRIIQLTAGMDMHSNDISQRIEQQESRLDNYERNMDIANAKTRQAKAAVKDLSTADHMFNFRTRGKREREVAEKTERDLIARQVEDETRGARQERQRAFQNTMDNNKPTSFARNTGKNKLAFDFDDDGFQAENDALDNEFDDKMDLVERSVGVINMRAKAIGFQIEQSNQRLPGLTEKTDSAIGTLQDTNHRLRQKMGQ